MRPSRSLQYIVRGKGHFSIVYKRGETQENPYPKCLRIHYKLKKKRLRSTIRRMMSGPGQVNLSLKPHYLHTNEKVAKYR